MRRVRDRWAREAIYDRAAAWKPRHDLGSKVSRLMDVFNPSSPLMVGTVTAIYCQTDEFDRRPSGFGRYPELYEVDFGPHGVKEGFFRFGINAVPVAVETGRDPVGRNH